MSRASNRARSALFAVRSCSRSARTAAISALVGAILCVDVYGYSRLMGQDEAATLATLTSYRKIIDCFIEQHCDRLINSAGDSVRAKSWELRSTMSLERLIAKQGRGNEASAMLVEIYNWFTEGFNTAALKETKAGELGE